MSDTDVQPLVLIVEDQADIRELTVQIVEDLGFVALTAENGRQALSVMQEMHRLPCVVLLDLMMPVMTGWQLMDALQEDERLRSVPVVVMTAVAEEFTSSLNVVAHLSKPTIFGELAGILEPFQHACTSRVPEKLNLDR